MANKDDIFAPPTPDELAAVQNDSKAQDDAMFAPPSPKELKSVGVDHQSTLDTAKNAGLGLLQGLTFNLAPKAEGALAAGVDKLQGAVLGQDRPDYSELYKQYQDIAKKKYANAEEENPKLFKTSEVAGAFVPGLFTAGAGLLAGAGNVGLREAAALGGPALAKALAKRAAEGAVVGGGAGGVSAFGKSEGDLTTEQGRAQAAQDALGGIKSGAKLGAIANPLIGVAGAGASAGGEAVAGKLANMAEDSPALQRLIAAFQRGSKTGKGFRGLQNEAELSANTRDEANQLASKLTGAKPALEGTVEQEAGTLGPAADAQMELMKLQEYQPNYDGNASFKKLQDTLNQFTDKVGGEEMSAQDLSGLKDQLMSLKGTLKDQNVQKIADDALNNIQGYLEKSPGYAKASGELNDFAEAGANKLLGGKSVQDLGPDAESVLGNKLTELARKSTSNKLSGEKSREQLNMFQKSMEQQDPELLNKMGIDNPSDLLGGLKNAARMEDVKRKIQTSSNPMQIVGSMLGLNHGGLPEGALLQGSNLAGKAVYYASKAAESPAGSMVSTFSKSLYNAPEAVLRSTASALRTGGFESIASSLERGLNEKNQATINAALFAAMQNPQTRHLVSGGELGTTEKK